MWMTQFHHMALTKTMNMERFWHVMFKVTDKCNIECDHCIENGNKKSNNVMPRAMYIKVMDDVARKIKPEERGDILYGLQGGEASLFPDVVRDIINEAHARGARVGMATNGWWGTPDKIDGVLSIGLDYIGLSCDAYHQRHIPLKNIYNILDALENHPTKIWLVAVVDDLKPAPRLDTKYQGKIYMQELPLMNAGRGVNLAKGPRPQTIKEGISVYWDGRVNTVCDWENYTATIGNAMRDDCYELLQKKCPGVFGRVCDQPCSGKYV